MEYISFGDSSETVMSAIKFGISDDIQHCTELLDDPWRYIIQNAATLSQEQVIEHASTADHLNVSGVFYEKEQHTLKLLAPKVACADAFKALYGLSVTMATGVVHPYLKQHVRTEWAIRLLSIKIHESPAFVFACRQKYHAVVIWMIEVMNQMENYSPILQVDCDGNTPLHIAIKNKKWEWAKRLMEHGSLPFLKNHKGQTPVMLTAPHFEYLTIFKQHSLEWFEALHEALVHGKKHPAWCQTLIDEGADFNQPELYDSPIESLLIFAHAGMDMNMSFDGELIDDQLKIMYAHGKIPTDFGRVLSVFQDDTWVRLLHNLVHGQHIEDEEYIQRIVTRRVVTKSTSRLQQIIVKK
tara:strand:- start:2150 stop:3211 length:1062 start_codon:yes stop_codon:yes gene_type:complete